MDKKLYPEKSGFLGVLLHRPPFILHSACERPHMNSEWNCNSSEPGSLMWVGVLPILDFLWSDFTQQKQQKLDLNNRTKMSAMLIYNNIKWIQECKIRPTDEQGWES